MQLKKYTDYGLRVLMYLACQPAQAMTSVRVICEVFNISANHVNKVVHHLAKLELIETRRGKHGGFMLAKPVEAISLEFVVRQLEGDEEWIECHSPACVALPACTLNSIIGEGKALFYRYLSNFSLADLVTNNKAELQQIFITNTPA
ncbi:RrF2 family transcriptional regulator [Aliidiomarina quisquiliarum]|uniref:RrF2 family transcriptional regulator n=1 Tax=Aliidiomarina quisquiliarum TaxID=2938947 RepID=UPI00208E629C|nr:Rrf2 family transcriptional regulator [Aliidiomarina quisquiliarum]MCO4320053.1 Rrf2 family transcriptional regulator [Aliidiomarina quisquiliarum]